MDQKEITFIIEQNKILTQEIREIYRAINSVYIYNIMDIPEFLVRYRKAVEVLLSMITKEQLEEFKEKYEEHYGVLDSIFLFELK